MNSNNNILPGYKPVVIPGLIQQNNLLDDAESNKSIDMKDKRGKADKEEGENKINNNNLIVDKNQPISNNITADNPNKNITKIKLTEENIKQSNYLNNTQNKSKLETSIDNKKEKSIPILQNFLKSNDLFGNEGEEDDDENVIFKVIFFISFFNTLLLL